VPGTVFGGAHVTNQTLRPAAFLPIKELSNASNLKVRQTPIVLYGGTIVSLWEDSRETDIGGSGTMAAESPASAAPRAALVAANGGTWSTTETPYSQTDSDNGVRVKASDAIIADGTTSRAAIEPNKPVGALMFDAYQNMSEVYREFDPQEGGVTVLLHGYTRFPYAAKNKIGSDAAWAIKTTYADVTPGGSGVGDVTLADTNKTWTVVGVGKIIKDGPLSRDILVTSGATTGEEEDLTPLIDWDATRAAAANVIVLAQSPSDVTVVEFTGWMVRTAIITAFDQTANTITVDDATYLGGALANNDELRDGEGSLIKATGPAVSNVIPVDDTDLTAAAGTLGVGGRITVQLDATTVASQLKPDTTLANGDYFMSGQWGQIVKFTPEVDPADQKLGRVFYVEPAGAHARNFAEKVEVVSGFDLTGDDTGGLPAFLFDEFGNAPTTARAVWVNLGAK